MKYTLVSVEKLKRSDKYLKGLPHLFDNELSGKELVKKVIILEETSEFDFLNFFKIGGFRINPFISAKKKSDVAAAINIYGFTIPGWFTISNKMPKRLRKTLTSKFAPGKSRLHIRLYKSGKNEWLATAHTDKNFLTLNIFGIYKNHIKSGAGNYELGTKILSGFFDMYLNGTEEDFENHVHEISTKKP